MNEVCYRKPSVRDASAVYSLVAQTAALDLNSWYYYAVFFRDFTETSMVVEVDGEFAGFVTAYLCPDKPDTLFLWQTATTLNHGVPNLGLDLIVQLIKDVQQRSQVRYIEATVDPKNKAISMQFRLLTRKFNVQASTEIAFAASDFEELEHDEQLLRIGPLS